MEWARDSEVLRFSKLQHWLHPNSPREDFLNYFEQEVIPCPWYRAICFDEHPIGFICIQPAGTESGAGGRALLFFALDRHYWGRGIATSAIREAVSTAFSEIHGLVRIEVLFILKIRPPNGCSKKAWFFH